MRLTLVTSFIAVAILCANTVNAQGISGWSAAIQADGPGYTNTNISAPTQVDIGTYDISTNGGVTYEFIYNADVGGASSAFMGSLNAPAGASAGLKLDQWNNTGKFGATAFGVADFTFGTDYVLNSDTQIAYVMDGSSTSFYVNGALAETQPGVSFALSGLTGLGHAYNHSNGGSVDALNGTILGVAVYDSALSADAVAGHYNAFVPEPSTSVLLGFGLLGLLGARRQRS
ncbi:MAG: VPDSG-CTERM sorting domain-containing protein [Planctomycetales bacterium]|nr:VPDSG-CTERM sorting domain-containing protein [Planctomycetales bacterium]